MLAAALLLVGHQLGATPGDSLPPAPLTLPVAEISATLLPPPGPVGSPRTEWADSSLARLPGGTVAELLAAESTTYLKTYGLGSLATSSLRGGSAGQTLVLWNGLPLSSPMLGLLDLSLLPLGAVGAVRLTPGGDGARRGSGAVGGVLELDSGDAPAPGLTPAAGFRYGSFGLGEQDVALSGGSERVRATTRFVTTRARNDFPFQPAPGLAERRQPNARLAQDILTQSLYWLPHPGRRLALHYWYQDTDREIPPTLVQNRSQASQRDRADRLALDYRSDGRRLAWRARAGYFREVQDYRDPGILLETTNAFRTLSGEATAAHHRGRHRLQLGAAGQATRATTRGYGAAARHDTRPAVFADWRYTSERLSLQLGGRQEWSGHRTVPFVPTLGAEYRPRPGWALRARAGRHYRLPTLNDRYWAPGGRADLRPESGWSQEAGLAYRGGRGRWAYGGELTAHHRRTDNWILWSVPPGENFFSAGNVACVRSYGLEPRLRLDYRHRRAAAGLRLGYDYLRATNEIAQESPRIAAGEQLIYTPRHRAFAALQLRWRDWGLGYHQHYTGPVAGINEPVAGFAVADLRLRYSGDFAGATVTAFASVHNLWDADYLVIERRPTPGRHLRTGVRFSFHSATQTSQ